MAFRLYHSETGRVALRTARRPVGRPSRRTPRRRHPDGVHPRHGMQLQEGYAPRELTSNFRAQLLCGFPCLQPFGCELILVDTVNEGTCHRAHPIGCEVE
jgi:hypothetical protein